MSRRRSRVLVSGYLGFGNIGDEALFSGLARGLVARGHEVTASSARPASTRAEHGVKAYHRLRGLPAALLDCDALVSGGGGLLQDATSRRSLSYYLGVVRLARALGKPVVVFGQSIGPLSEAGGQRVAHALAGLPIAVRDRTSQRLATRLGLASTLVADTALLLPLPTPLPPDPGEDAPLLLIPRAGVAGATEALLALARETRSGGRRVAALALQPGPDALEVDRLVREVPGVEAWRAAGPSEALAHCAAAGYVVSVRLHGAILAARAGRGHAGVGYDPKVEGFLAESGGRLVPVPVDPDVLVRAARERAPLPPARRDALVDRAEGGLDWLDAALRRARAGVR